MDGRSHARRDDATGARDLTQAETGADALDFGPGFVARDQLDPGVDMQVDPSVLPAPA